MAVPPDYRLLLGVAETKSCSIWQFRWLDTVDNHSSNPSLRRSALSHQRMVLAVVRRPSRSGAWGGDTFRLRYAGPRNIGNLGWSGRLPARYFANELLTY